MMRARYIALISSTAFANPTAPSAQPLVGVLDQMVNQDELLSRTPDIAAMMPYWDTTDAIVEGYDAIKTGGELYLPKFRQEPADDYKVRLSLTKFTNVYRDIVESLAAKPFEEEITLPDGSKDDSTKPPQEILDFVEDVDGSGSNLTAFASETFFNGINSAIDWIFVDYPTVDLTVVRTKADEKAAGTRPFWSHVLARNVLEVRTKLIAGKRAISYIRIFEPGVNEPDHVRIFERNDIGVVTWQLYVRTKQPKDGKSQFALEKNGQLSIGEIPLVPFWTGRRDGTSWKFFPVMRDAADLQIQLYQDESALKFIKTMAGYPMLAANGIRPEMEADGKTPKKVAIGPMKVLFGIPDGNGNAGEWTFIEPSATSMEFLQKSIDKTKEDLRELGRQPLTANSGNLTVITTAVAAGKAISAVSAWALGLKNALENALLITAEWMKIDYDPQVNVYTEFDNFNDNATDVTALGTMREKGDLSQETYWNELRRRKVLSPEFNAEKERELLLNEIPSEEDDMTAQNSGAISWLQKAIKLHEKHMNGTAPTDKESQSEMMTQMKNALSSLQGSGSSPM